MIGKTAAIALSKLIGIGLTYPEALIASQVQKIKDDAAARSLITERLSHIIADRAAVSPDLLDRTEQRLLGAAIREQINLEAVASAAADDLSQTPPKPDVKAVDDDFIARLAEASKSASGDEMRALYARILAGEVRKPGTFSFGALHVLSLMDATIAPSLERVASLVTEGHLLKDPTFISSDILIDVGIAQDLGLLRSQELTYSLLIKDVTKIRLPMIGGASMTILRPQGASARKWEGWPVSKVGNEVFSLMTPPLSSVDKPTLGAALLKTVGGHAVIYQPPSGVGVPPPPPELIAGVLSPPATTPYE